MKIIKTFEGYKKDGEYVSTKKDIFDALFHRELGKAKEYLIKRPDLINCENKYKTTILEYVCQINNLDENDILNFVKFLIDKNIKITSMSVVFAADRTDSDILKLLIKNGADPNSKTGLGTSALIFAASKGNIKNIQILLDAGADIDYVSGRGSALYDAYESGHDDAVKYLIIRGADIFKENYYGRIFAEKLIISGLIKNENFIKDILTSRPELIEFFKPFLTDNLKKVFAPLLTARDLNLF